MVHQLSEIIIFAVFRKYPSNILRRQIDQRNILQTRVFVVTGSASARPKPRNS